MNSFKIIRKSSLSLLEDELIKPIVHLVNTYILKVFHIKENSFFHDLQIEKLPSINFEPNKDILKSFKGLHSDISIRNIQSNVLAIIELNDKRIATAGEDGSISVISINYENKTWTHEIKKEKAHDDEINYLCKLINNILISCSDDKLIKIWKILPHDLILNKTLSHHFANILKVIPLTHYRFSSCSQDFTIRIWSSLIPYQELSILNVQYRVYSIIQLNHKEILISSSADRALHFWNINKYCKEYSLKEIYTLDSNGMIELYNGYIAVSSDTEGFPIAIIDPSHYVVVKQIWNEQFIPCGSSLCSWCDKCFIYVCNGSFLQISAIDYTILHKNKNEEKLFGNKGIISIQKGKYLIVDNYSDGLDVLYPYY